MRQIILMVTLLSIMPVYSQTAQQAGTYKLSGKSSRILSQPEAIAGVLSGLDVRLNVMPFPAYGRIGNHLGSEIEFFQETTWREDLPADVFRDTRTDYGDISRPIITNPAADYPFMLDIGYTYLDTRIGFSWSRMSGSWEQSGLVPGLNLYEAELAEGFGYGFVNFWKMGWDLHASRNFPASWLEGFRDLDNNEDMNYQIQASPERGNTEWEASHNISFNSLQLNVQHPVFRNDILWLSLVGGIQYGRWRDNVVQTLEITAHRQFTDRWTQYIYFEEPNEDSLLVEIYNTVIFHNDITLSTSSSTEFNSFGLLAGIEADLRVLPFLSFMVRAGTSSLSGEARSSGSGIDIDDIVDTDRMSIFDMEENLVYADELQGFEFLSGVFTLPDYTYPALSLNYFMNFSARYNITNNIFLTGGYYYSKWTNLPVSPRWSYSDTRTRPYDAFALEESWDKEVRSNFSTSGFQVGIGFLF